MPGPRLLETVGTLAQQANHALKRGGLNKYFTTSSTGADLYDALETRPGQWQAMQPDLDSVEVPADAVDTIAARDKLSAS